MNYRYPGIHSFTAADANIFFGRENEAKELLRLVALNDVVVLFSKSGSGKTSLLQAGIGPKLQEQQLRALKIRLNNTAQSINRQLFEQFNDGEYLPVDTSDNLCLWEYCKLFEYSEGGKSFTPVLLFDQFEELFTLYHDNPAAQQDFIIQLADVLNGNIPEHLKNTAKKDWSEDVTASFFAPPKVRILISIRSDYLYLLDRISERAPSILRCRYELHALNEKNAIQAIEKPAGLKGAFESPKFQYSPTALQNIIINLTTITDSENVLALPKENQEIEAFQLQLICRHIEQKIIEDKTTAGYQITADFYGKNVGIAEIRSKFYQSVLALFDDLKRQKIQVLVENKLLNSNRRIIQEGQFLIDECRVTEEDLHTLTNERLLKVEPRAGSFYYEISHDTLIAPIVKVQKARKIKEEEDDKITQLKEEQREQNRKRLKIFSYISIVLAILGITSATIAFIQSGKAQENQRVAERALMNFKIAEYSRKVEERAKESLNFDKLIANGDLFLKSSEFALALRQYKNADSIFQRYLQQDSTALQRSSYLRQKIKESLSRQSSNGNNNVIDGENDPPLEDKTSKNEYSRIVKDADLLMNARQYDLALNKLQSARAISPDKSYEIDLRITKMFRMINDERIRLLSKQ